jgi:NADH dehydrogenase FAD-containing subunit
MPSILVVGGGFAGIAAAQHLLKSKKVTVHLVDRKDYFEVTPAQLRALVSPETVGASSRIPYADILGAAFVHAEVVELEAQAAVLADGSRLSFDILILAPGTRYPRFSVAKPHDHLTKAQRWDHNQSEHSAFREAPGYLVIGGGLVGVELAAELAAYSGGKKVRLAHLGPRLVENLNPKASALALDHLTKLGVTVELNNGKAEGRDGELVYHTTSPVPSTGFLKEVRPAVLDAKGAIQVDAQLKVLGHPHWFAIGDANNFPDGKQAATAGVQGAYVAKAILSGLDPKKPAPKPYSAQPTMALAPLGKTLGFAQLPFGVVKWKFLVDIKRKDGLVSMFRKRLGAKAR